MQLDLTFLESRVDARDDALFPESRARFANQLRPLHSSRIDRDLVGARAQNQGNVSDFVDAAADRQWNEKGFGGSSYDVEQRPAAFSGCRDVEKDDLIGALGFVPLRQLDRVTHIAKVREARAFDDAAVLHVEADDDSFAQHQFFSSRSRRTRPLVLNTVSVASSASRMANATALKAPSTIW